MGKNWLRKIKGTTKVTNVFYLKNVSWKPVCMMLVCMCDNILHSQHLIDKFILLQNCLESVVIYLVNCHYENVQ